MQRYLRQRQLQEAINSKALVRTSTPAWLASTTLALAEEAEADASGQACPVVSRQLPSWFDPAESHVPYMPPHCCSSPVDTGCLQPGDTQRQDRQLQYRLRDPGPLDTLLELTPVSATMSSTYSTAGAAYCIDGDSTTMCHTTGGSGESNPYVKIDFGRDVSMERASLLQQLILHL